MKVQKDEHTLNVFEVWAEEAQKRINPDDHPDESELKNLCINAVLSQEERKNLQKHLRNCQTCRQRHWEILESIERTEMSIKAGKVSFQGLIQNVKDVIQDVTSVRLLLPLPAASGDSSTLNELSYSFRSTDEQLRLFVSEAFEQTGEATLIVEVERPYKKDLEGKIVEVKEIIEETIERPLLREKITKGKTPEVDIDHVKEIEWRNIEISLIG